ncbi:membrane protein insertion efficiency factor YidD [Candidatus Uhrbacteria bacterium]|nr:membrane protein insertion efficiency factor YidD [Candidatus Uhrbacteria bacterium]
MRGLAAFIISVYQRTLSGDHGWLRPLFPYGVCKFHPTCSEYTRQSILKYGIVIGSIKGVKRIVRCHPWGKGGHDPVK